MARVKSTSRPDGGLADTSNGGSGNADPTRRSFGVAAMSLAWHPMDDERARMLLAAERERVQQLLDATLGSARDDRVAASDEGDMTEPAEPLVSEQVDDAIAAGLRDRLDAIGRAEQRLAAGTYGRSVRSGVVIPDERLEADPAAELTVPEAEQS
jgi:DnaK suppressor protein